MKKILLKKENLLSLLSIIMLALFVIFAMGSAKEYEEETEHLGDGVYRSSYYRQAIMDNTNPDFDEAEFGFSHSITGKRDKFGNWHGTVEVKHGNGNTDILEMVHGKKHGKATIEQFDGTKKTVCYWEDLPVPCNKSLKIQNVEINAFNILNDKYPFALKFFHTGNFENEYLQSFFNEIESDLDKQEITLDEFDDFYEDAIVGFEETIYDSLINFNEWLRSNREIGMLKGNIFRLATIERNKNKELSTFNVIKNTYPHYIDFVVSWDEATTASITENGFKIFCNDYDAKFDQLNPLNQEDPMFIDSINNRIYRVFNEMYNESYNSASLKSGHYSQILNSYYMPIQSKKLASLLKSTSAETDRLYIQIIYLSRMQNITGSDIIYNCVKKAWIQKNNIMVPPLIGTHNAGGDGNTAANIYGNIIEDGGSTVSSRGIVWAETYNPTIENNKIESGSGLGEFSVEISGLENNKRYFARAYAVSDVGTTYGNCVEFSTTIISSSDFIEHKELDFDVYPNPTGNIANLSFTINTPNEVNILVSNMQGQIVLQKKLGVLKSGTNICKLDLSDLKNGIYNCTIINGNSTSNKKLVVSR